MWETLLPQVVGGGFDLAGDILGGGAGEVPLPPMPPMPPLPPVVYTPSFSSGGVTINPGGTSIAIAAGVALVVGLFVVAMVKK